MPGRAHAISAHTTQLPLNKISQRILDYAALDRDGIREVISLSVNEASI